MEDSLRGVLEEIRQDQKDFEAEIRALLQFRRTEYDSRYQPGMQRATQADPDWRATYQKAYGSVPTMPWAPGQPYCGGPEKTEGWTRRETIRTSPNCWETIETE